MDLGSYTTIEEIPKKKGTSNSRYKSGKAYSDGTKVFLPSFRFFEVDETPEDQFHVVQSGEVGRLDLIAYKYYEAVDLWWVIAFVNKDQIQNPLRFESGITIRIPPLEIVFGEIVT